MTVLKTKYSHDIRPCRAVLAFAGVMVLVSVLLSAFVSPLFIWFTGFIGLNMFQSAFTGLWPAAVIFRKPGLRDRAASGAA